MEFDSSKYMRGFINMALEHMHSNLTDSLFIGILNQYGTKKQKTLWKKLVKEAK